MGSHLIVPSPYLLFYSMILSLFRYASSEEISKEGLERVAYFLESFNDRKTISPMVDGLGNKNSVVYLREGQHFQDSRSITKREKRSQSPLCRHARLTTTMNNEDGRKRDHFPALRISFPRSEALSPDIYFLKHTCSILRQSSNPVFGSWKSQASSLWAEQHRP